MNVDSPRPSPLARLSRTLSLIALGFAGRQLAAAPPVANLDVYSTNQGEFLSVPAPGVLANDTPGTGTTTAELVRTPTDGTLFLGPNGSISYTPNPGFTGTDSFTYLARSNPGPQVFNVVRNMSSLDLTVKLNTAFGNDTQSAMDLAVIGTFTALPTPNESPFSTFHIQDLSLTVDDNAALNFCLVRFIGCNAGVDAEASAGEISLTMGSPGPPGVVDAAGMFDQPGNTVDFDGTICVTPTGLASGVIPAGPQALVQSGLPLDIADCTISQSGSTLTLEVPIGFTQNFVIDADNNISADVELQGTIIATAPVAPVEDSETVTVTIEVTALDTDSDGLPDDYEIANGLDPDIDDSLNDADCDGQSNFAEFLAGTDPQDPKSTLGITAFSPSGSGFNVVFQTVTGRSYCTETSSDMVTWEKGLVIEATTTTSTFFWRPTKGSTNPEFVRIRAVAP